MNLHLCEVSDTVDIPENPNGFEEYMDPSLAFQAAFWKSLRETHLCEIYCLQSELSQTFPPVNIAFGGACDSTTTKLGSNTVLEGRVLFQRQGTSENTIYLII